MSALLHAACIFVGPYPLPRGVALVSRPLGPETADLIRWARMEMEYIGAYSRAVATGMELRIFLACSFDEADRSIVETAASVIEATGATVVRGTQLGGEELGTGVQHLIRTCDGLVALLTPERENSSRSRPWIHDEYAIAKTLGIAKIAVAFSAVQVEGFGANDERIQFDVNDPVLSWLKLSRTVQQWRQRRQLRRSRHLRLLAAAVGALCFLVGAVVGATQLGGTKQPAPSTSTFEKALREELDARLFDYDECAMQEHDRCFRCKEPADKLREVCNRALKSNGGR